MVYCESNSSLISMLNLYYKPYCPYCVRVIAANEQIKAPLVLLDVMSDSAVVAVLFEKGGKTQVPFLEDTDRGIMMYESLDIIDYLQTNYGQGEAPVVSAVPNVCPID